MTEFGQMLRSVRQNMDADAKTVAKGIGISPQYLSDLEHGRRLPSVVVTNRICKWLGRGPKGRSAWHLAAARARGFDV